MVRASLPDPAPVPAGLAAAITRTGPVAFSVVMEHALYGPDGFYERGGGAGRRRDFITSPEVGALFGALVAEHLDRCWDSLDRPDPFLVVEAGAGPGTLARAVLAARPACAGALRYLLVDRAAGMRDLHRDHLTLVSPAELLGTLAADPDDPDSERRVVPGQGPLVASAAHLPAERFTGVILANELLDNLPMDLLQREPDGWAEVRAGLDAGGGLAEVLVPATHELAVWASRLVPDAPVGCRIPVQRAAAAWVAEALGLLQAGSLTLVDYVGAHTNDLARRPWTDWLRTYRGQGRGGHPLEHPGTQDITAEVAVDQLPTPTRVSTQADALRRWGVDHLVQQARDTWQERSAIGDLAALMARSRVLEADALLDPDGLGAFGVLEWEVRPGGRVAGADR